MKDQSNWLTTELARRPSSLYLKAIFLTVAPALSDYLDINGAAAVSYITTPVQWYATCMHACLHACIAGQWTWHPCMA